MKKHLKRRIFTFGLSSVFLASLLCGGAEMTGTASSATLQQQIDGAASGAVITLAANDTESVTVAAGKVVTLDLNGFTLTAANGTAVTNNGTLTVTDSTGKGGIAAAANGSDAYGILNNGTLTYCGGSTSVSTSTKGVAYGISNKGTLTVTGGSLNAVTTGSDWAYGIYNTATVAKISGGAISGTINNTSNGNNALGVSNEAGATLTLLSGGSITASVNNNGMAYGLRNRGSISEISGGSISAATSGAQYAYALWNTSGSTVTRISGGTLIGSITSGNGNNALALNNEGTVSSVTGGVFHGATNGTGSGYGLRCDGKVLSVSGGAFLGNNASNAVYQRNGTITYAQGYALSDAGSFGYRYVMPAGSFYVQLSDEQANWVAAFIYDASGSLLSSLGDVENSYTVYRWKDDQTTRTVTAAPTDFGALKANTTLYVQKDTGNRPIYYFLGSSVTRGEKTNGVSFVEDLAQENNWICLKSAVSGTTLTDTGSDSYVARMKSQFGTHAPMDAFICQLSTNDATQNKPLGQVVSGRNLTDFDTSTIVGSMEYIICYAQSTWKCPVVFFTNPNFSNALYEQMITALYQLQSKWGVGVIDFYHYKYMDALSASTLSSYMADSIHPNAAGYEWMAGVMKPYLSALPATEAVRAQINALPAADAAALTDQTDVTAARTAYNALPDSQKGVISADTLAKLTADEAAIQALSDQAAAAPVIAAINALPAADAAALTDESAVSAARTAYNALTDAQKALVSADALAKLTADEAAIQALQDAQSSACSSADSSAENVSSAEDVSSTEGASYAGGASSAKSTASVKSGSSGTFPYTGGAGATLPLAVMAAAAAALVAVRAKSKP